MRNPRFSQAVLLVCTLSGCSKMPWASSEPADAGEVTSYYVDVADDKTLLYNLVGRWYPGEEIARFSDKTLTAEQWCEREPAVVFVMPESVQIRCQQGAPQSAMIARVQRDKDGKITLTMRAKEDSALKQLHFETRGSRATISGNPCFDGKPVAYGRFPEYEIWSREILGGRRCAQVARAAE